MKGVFSLNIAIAGSLLYMSRGVATFRCLAASCVGVVLGVRWEAHYLIDRRWRFLERRMCTDGRRRYLGDIVTARCLLKRCDRIEDVHVAIKMNLQEIDTRFEVMSFPNSTGGPSR